MELAISIVNRPVEPVYNTQLLALLALINIDYKVALVSLKYKFVLLACTMTVS